MVFKRPAVSKSGTVKTPKFKYRARTAEEMHKRAHQNAGNREGYIRPDINTWTPDDGENKIRILPPSWDEAEHYGMEIWVHYSVGGDKATYLCLAKMRGESCPVCEVRQELDHAGDADAARELLPRKRVAMYVIDRNEESKGPLVWAAPWTLDQEIAKQAIDEDGGALSLDSPEEGYDITFTREQQGKNVPPKYVGVKVARKASPMFDTEEEVEATLDYITENAMPDCLVFHDYDSVKKVFEGGPDPRSKPEETPPERKAKALLKSKGKKEPEPEPPLPTWDEVHAMDENQVTALAEAAQLDFADEEFESLEACQDWVCEHMDIEKPKPKTSKPTIGKKKSAEAEGGTSDWKAKIAKLKGKS